MNNTSNLVEFNLDPHEHPFEEYPGLAEVEYTWGASYNDRFRFLYVMDHVEVGYSINKGRSYE